MSAIGGPDEHSHTEQPETSEQYNSAEIGSEYDQNYEPEREFVLMPLFRRIGKLLGLRRGQESEYIYQLEQSAGTQEPESRAMGPREEVVLPETAIQYSEPQLPAETTPSIESAPELVEKHQGSTQEPVEEDVLQLESVAPEPVLQQSSTEGRELTAEPIRAESQPEFTPASSVGDEVGQGSLISARTEAPEMKPTPSMQEDWPTPTAQDATPSPSRKRNAEEVRQLVAPLREAAVKITAIVAQAAEWLRAKEEEFLRSAEVNPAKAGPKISPPSELRSPAEGFYTENAWQNSEASPLQQEETERLRRERELRPVPIQFVAKPDRPLSVPAVPLWKRINWAEEFTPMRVGLLGGLAMAVLLVLGISLARRPASSELPEPQQTRSIEPGGVTVTTHPIVAPAPPRVLRKTSASDRRSPIPPQHRSRRASADAYDDEPDVIVHHYDTAKKPSPVKQTTVAGVRHYSDM